MDSTTTENTAIETVTVDPNSELGKALATVTQLQADKERYTDLYWKESSKVTKIRLDTRDFFKAEFGGDKDAEITLTVDEVNDLLNRIGAEELKFTYSAKVTISFIIEGVEAEDDEDAQRKIEHAVNWTINGLDYDTTTDEEIEVDEVEAE